MKKRTSNAQRPKAGKASKPVRAPRRAIPYFGMLIDLETGQLFDKETRLPLPPSPPPPPPTKQQIEASRERARKTAAWYAARREAFNARLARRPVDMQRIGYKLPQDVVAFLERLHPRLVERVHDDDWPMHVDKVKSIVDEAYWEGCRQGFIEGFLYGEDKARPGALKNRERLRQQNLEKLERLGIADRNAEIVAEFRRLERDMPGAEDRYAHLADSNKTGRDDWPTSARQIANIVRAASKRRR
jgi:hypothetical protein